MRRLIEILKISRPGFWPTHVWFYVLPFATINMFGSFKFWLGAFYVCFPMSLLLYGWNDIGDWKTDQDNPRKDSWLFGACPDQELRRMLPALIVMVQLPFVLLFWYLAGFKMLILFAGLIFANFAYNNLNFKSIAGIDLLNQSGYLLVFVLASWLCDVPQLNWAAMLFGALFAMQSHLFGQIMDIEQDQSSGRRSTAIMLGSRNAKRLLATIMSIEAMIAFSYFNGGYLGFFMLAGSLFFAADSFIGPEKYPLSFIRVFFIGWNIVVATTIHFIWKYGMFLLAA